MYSEYILYHRNRIKVHMEKSPQDSGVKNSDKKHIYSLFDSVIL